MKATAIDHICIAVKDLAKARKAYEETLGLVLALTYEAPTEKIRVARYYLGEVALELMEDLDGTGEVAKFIARKGEGVFLVSYRVADVAEGLRELKDKGIKTIDETPRRLMGNRYAFLQPPAKLAGVLTEILDGDFEPQKD